MIKYMAVILALTSSSAIADDRADTPMTTTVDDTAHVPTVSLTADDIRKLQAEASTEAVARYTIWEAQQAAKPAHQKIEAAFKASGVGKSHD